MESVKCNKTRRRKFLDSPRSNIKLPKAWAYKEYQIDTLLKKVNCKKLKYKVSDLSKQATGNYNLPCLTSGTGNQGLSCFAPREKATILKNVISIASNGSAGATYYQDSEFTILQDAYAIESKNKELSREQYLYLVSTISKLTLKKFSWTDKAGWNKVSKEKIYLPVRENGEIDFAFMEQYIRELELARIRELELYLKVCGFTDCTLTQEELSAIEKEKQKKYKNFAIKELFDIATGRDVIIGNLKDGNIPLISHKNDGNGIVKLISKLPNRRLFNYKSTISLADRGVFCATTQDKDFHVGTRVKALTFKTGDKDETIRLFFVASINKLQILFKEYLDNATDKLPNLQIQLPVNKNGEIDFDFMQVYIRAIEKQIIKHIVDWKDKEIAEIKKICK